MALRLSKCNIHQGEVVFHFHTGVMMDGVAPLPVKSGFVERDVDVVVLFNIVGGDFAIDAAELDKLPDLVVVCGQRRWFHPDTEVKLGAHYDVVGKADDGGLDLSVRSLGAGCFGRDIMDIGYSFRGHGDLVHT